MPVASEEDAQAVRDLDEKLVSGPMTEAIVDDLEPVEINEQHGRWKAAAGCLYCKRRFRVGT